MQNTEEYHEHELLQKKYNFLLSMLQITDVDLWEKDALLSLKKKLYFQFSEEPGTLDECVQAAYFAELDLLEGKDGSSNAVVPKNEG